MSNRRLGPISSSAGAAAVYLVATMAAATAFAQANPLRGPPGCIPVSERKMELGCYLVDAGDLGDLPNTELYWQIASYPTRSAADAAKSPMGTVVEALDQI